MKRLLIPAAALAVLLAAPAQAQDRFTNPFGGTGGQQYIRRCPPGASVTGVAALVGAYVNNIAPICDGRALPGAGGGGNQRSASCPTGSVVRSMEVVLLRSPGHQVKALQLACYARGTGQRTASVPLDTPGAYTMPAVSVFRPIPGYPVTSMDCGRQDIVGLQGRAGAAVDAVGLICGAAGR